jgi:hypothetical protein
MHMPWCYGVWCMAHHMHMAMTLASGMFVFGNKVRSVRCLCLVDFGAGVRVCVLCQVSVANTCCYKL